MSNESLLDTIYHIQAVQLYMSILIKQLQDRMRYHDQSKLEEPELSGYAGLSEAVKGLEYGSMAYRTAMKPYKDIIKHHYENNDHHAEFFQNGIEDMTLVQLIEMIVDWKAASTRSSMTLSETIDSSLLRFKIDIQLSRIIKNTIESNGW